MNKMNKTLGALLAAQLVLIAITWTTCYSKPKEVAARNFFNIDYKDVIEIEVTSKPPSDGKPPRHVKLIKEKDGWVIPDADNFAAKEDKVKEVLDKLLEVKVRNPIATNEANHMALKVADNEYDRKVTIKTKSETKTAILGSGSRGGINIRFAGQKEVYQAGGAGVSVWSINDHVRNYIEQKYIDVDSDTLNQVVITNAQGNLNFAKEGDEWMLVELPKTETLDQNKVKTFMKSIVKLDIQEPIGKKVKPEYGFEGGQQVVLLYTKDDESKSLTYKIGKDTEDNTVYAKSNDSDFVVTVLKHSVNQLREKKLEDFFKAKEEDKKEDKEDKEDKD